MVRSWTRWFIALCASPLGVPVLAALDSTLFFSLPFGIDAAVILLAARMGPRAAVVPLLATGGSVAGAALTFWMGEKIGEKGLDRYVSPHRLKRIRARIRKSGAIALALLDLIPPPFPFTPFVLAAGALDVKTSTFFITLTVCRIFRFGVDAALAVVSIPTCFTRSHSAVSCLPRCSPV
jgi:membrane protein YqaA with SNARE-associated domain